MRNFLIVGAAMLAAGLLTGCGHNAIQYGDGVGFDAGVNPENYTLSFNMRYGKILSAVTRDNVEIELNGKANADGTSGEEKSVTGSVGTDGHLKVKIGRQINGAAVDLVKAGADANQVLKELTGETNKIKEEASKTETEDAAEPKTETAAENAPAEIQDETQTETQPMEVK